MTEKKKFVIFGIVLSIFLLALAVAFSGYVHDIGLFNEEERISENVTNSPQIYARVLPRRGTTDAWEKEFKGVRGYDMLHALIYDTVIHSELPYEVSSWNLRVNITSDCLLNNGWNGTFEIHQNVEDAKSYTGSEIVETINLQKYSNVLFLDHFYIDQDLMIPLKKGDYFIYHPEYSVKEVPIPKVDFSTEDFRESKVGFIIYYEGNEPVFDSSILTYKLYCDCWSGKEALTYKISFVALCFLMVIFFTALIYRGFASRRIKQSNLLISSAMSVFTGFFEAKDPYTRGHSKRVAEYSRELAKECGLDEDELRTVYHIAYMHDCGKCYIPDSILKKEGRLTDEEFEIIKSHTVKGAEMVADFTAIEGLQDGVRHHHEKYDGHGYPDGLKGEEIPWIARVICIADSYDAMSSDRCYRKHLSDEQIMEEFEKCKGKQFDPKLTDLFIEILRKQNKGPQ